MASQNGVHHAHHAIQLQNKKHAPVLIHALNQRLIFYQKERHFESLSVTFDITLPDYEKEGEPSLTCDKNLIMGEVKTYKLSQQS